jgi:tRNA-2-methylthio-N6-dimethylallyladenosine synthase
MMTVGVTYAAPHHLVADSSLAVGTYAVRATRAGDAHQRATAPATPAPADVLLGMPSVGSPSLNSP